MRIERFEILKAELISDIKTLSELEEKYKLIKAKIQVIKPDEFDYIALAYTITNLYNIMENYFLRIAKHFENNINQYDWHKDLVKRMTLEIDKIRPALLNSSDLPLIDELRAFRHVFRHIYQRELDIEKLKMVDSKTTLAVKIFKDAHAKFMMALESLISEIES